MRFAEVTEATAHPQKKAHIQTHTTAGRPFLGGSRAPAIPSSSESSEEAGVALVGNSLGVRMPLPFLPSPVLWQALPMIQSLRVLMSLFKHLCHPLLLPSLGPPTNLLGPLVTV